MSDLAMYVESLDAPASECYLLLTGSVSLVRSAEDRRKEVFKVLAAGNLVGELDLIN